MSGPEQWSVAAGGGLARDDDDEAEGRTCAVAPLCEPHELEPLLAALRANERLAAPRAVFPRGTLTDDGRLDLCKQAIGPEGARAVAGALERNAHVTSLLLGADRLGPEGARAIAAMLERNRAVRTVYMGCNAIGAEGARSLATALEGNDAVRGLWLKRNELGPDGARAIAAMLRANRAVRTLDLVSNAIGPEGLDAVASAIETGAQVESLYVCGNALGAAGAARLASLLARPTALRALYLAANDVGDEGARAIGAALGSNATLRALGLASNDIGPDGARAIAAALSTHPSLELLELGFAPSTDIVGARPNRVGDEGALALASALRTNARLSTLDLARASVGAAGTRALLDALEQHRALAVLRLGPGLEEPDRRRLMALLCRNANARGAVEPSRDLRDIRSVYRTARPGAQPAPAPARAKGPAMVDPRDVGACLRVLRALGDGRPLADTGPHAPELRSLLAKVQRVSHAARAGERRRVLAARRAADRALRESTGLRRGRAARALGASHAPPSPDARALVSATPCYVCKAPYTELDGFYDRLCPACAEQNRAARGATADLAGRVALVTGARVKIGHQVALKLLRAGARVVATTRFPHDAARRFAMAPDFEAFRARLAIHGLDLRDLRVVERFGAELASSLPHLDVLVHNAAQTLRRSPAQLAKLARLDALSSERLSPEARLLVAASHSHALSSTAPTRDDALLLLPRGPLARVGLVDEDGQPPDYRETNSWRMLLDDVPTAELVETHLINAFAPFVLDRALKPALLRSPSPDRYVVHVSAVEGQFERPHKTARHPHTNMAKAALNMLTRTSAQDLARDGIYMTSVDTGWVSNENPHRIAARMERSGFQCPLDAVDGAARVLDPVFRGIATGERLWGVFLKDYAVARW